MFDVLAYKTSTTVTVILPLPSRTSSTSLRWRQLSHDGTDLDVWALDHIRIQESVYDRRHVVNFDLSFSVQESSSYDVRLEYSTDFGQTYALVQPDCLPSSSHCSHALVSNNICVKYRGNVSGAIVLAEQSIFCRAIQTLETPYRTLASCCSFY